MEAARTRSWVPSREPPSALMMTERARGKYFNSPARTDCTICPTVWPSLYVGKPTRISTSPTLISSRMKSSESMLPSATKRSTRTQQSEPRIETSDSDELWQILHSDFGHLSFLYFPQLEPIKLIRPEREQV